MCVVCAAHHGVMENGGGLLAVPWLLTRDFDRNCSWDPSDGCHVVCWV
jgi:hypothetical protein